LLLEDWNGDGGDFSERRSSCRARLERRIRLTRRDQLTHIHRYALVDAIEGCWFPLYTCFLPSITPAEHALLESRTVSKTSDITGLTIAKIERGLRDSGTARVPVWPDQIPVNLVDHLIGVHSSGA
jgi:hypothetical protein